eukprot:1157220-Pelagomonas_calceolata.AAC.9
MNGHSITKNEYTCGTYNRPAVLPASSVCDDAAAAAAAGCERKQSCMQRGLNLSQRKTVTCFACLQAGGPLKRAESCAQRLKNSNTATLPMSAETSAHQECRERRFKGWTTRAFTQILSGTKT